MEQLKLYYGKVPMVKLALALGRTRRAMYDKAFELGLTRSKS